jgi:hypothetical protein
MPLPSQITYELHQERQPARTYLHISNPTDYDVSGLECRVVIRNWFGGSYRLDVERADKVVSRGSVDLTYFDWSDMAMALLDVRYYLPSHESFEELGKIIQSLSAGSTVIEDLRSSAERGIFRIDHVEFAIDFSTKSTLEPAALCSIPPSYLSLLKDRWFELIPAENISATLSYLKTNTVLVLGHDSGVGLERMQAIALSLTNQGYEPVLLKEQVDHRYQSLEEKLITFAMLSRFVVVDDSEPSGHIDELHLLSRSRIVTIILHQEGVGGTYMQADYAIDFNFMSSHNYTCDSLVAVINEAIGWAEGKIRSRTTALKQAFPWRR